MKLIILAMMIAIVLALGSAVYELMKIDVIDKKTVHSLTFRISLSLGLFILLYVGAYLNWWQPHALVPPPPAATEEAAQPDKA